MVLCPDPREYASVSNSLERGLRKHLTFHCGGAFRPVRLNHLLIDPFIILSHFPAGESLLELISAPFAADGADFAHRADQVIDVVAMKSRDPVTNYFRN